MFRRRIIMATLAVAVAAPALAGGLLCQLRLIHDEAVKDEFVSELRAEGPAGLAMALARYDEVMGIVAEIDRQAPQTKATNPRLDETRAKADETLATMRRAIDRIAGQRDATVSRLYWYTDLEEAKAAAAESGKPILSLRMLGKLTDEFSCANSRFFRTALYSNKEISDYLRDNYVLHWQSVRPVPRVTIDFGDGRKLERTVTGNSAHYALDSTGRPLDALPGLYGPQAFAEWLRSVETLAQQLAASDPADFDKILKQHHAGALSALEGRLAEDLSKVEATKTTPQLVQLISAPARGDKPNAMEAGYRAAAKGQAEVPIVRQIVTNPEALDALDDGVWQEIAALHRDEAALDGSSVGIIRREHPEAATAGALAASKRKVEDPILRIVRNFEEAMAIDMVRNEYTLHRQVHAWFAGGEAPSGVDALNERVYAELFLTPSSDPWLGLAPANVYTALTDGGVSANP